MTPKLDRPILVTGTPRSGKSCVVKVLKQAPEFVYLSEPLMIWDAVPGGRSDDRLTAEDVTEAARDRIRRDCAAAVAKAGRARYLDDLAYHAVRLPFVHGVMPEAKIIHVIRDPLTAIPEMTFGWAYRDSMVKAIARRRKGIRLRTLPRQLARFALNYFQSRSAGRRETWGPRVPGLREVVKAQSAAEAAAYQWELMIRLAREDLRTLPSEQWIEVRFEDLIAKPEKMFGRLAEFAEISDPKAIVEYSQAFIDPDFQFEKRVEPTADEWERISQRLGQLTEELGYAPISSNASRGLQ